MSRHTSIFRLVNIEFVIVAKNDLINVYSHKNRYKKAYEILNEGFEDVF